MAANIYGSGGDDLSSTFWEAVASGTFIVQRCGSCGKHRFPPNSLCAACHSLDFDWIPIKGTAEIYSYTIVHRPPTDAWADKVPYPLIIGQLTEGPLVLGHLADADVATVEVGQSVVLRIDRHDATRSIYHFAPVWSADHLAGPEGTR